LQKLILKTVLITVIAFIGVIAITFGVLALCCPGVIADVAGGLGCNSVCSYFRESQYKKTESFEDLKKLVVTLDPEKDSIKTSLYSAILLDDNLEEFKAYAKEDGKSEFLTENNAIEYFFDKYALAEFNNGNVTNAINVANSCVIQSGLGVGYTETTPFRTLIYGKTESLTISDIDEIREQLSRYLLLTALSPSDKDRIQEDIAQLGIIEAEKQST